MKNKPQGLSALLTLGAALETAAGVAGKCTRSVIGTQAWTSRLVVNAPIRKVANRRADIVGTIVDVDIGNPRDRETDDAVRCFAAGKARSGRLKRHAQES